MTVRFECTTHSAMPIQQLFDLARSIDAHTGSMAKSRERAIAGTVTGLIGLGQDVTWRAWHFGVPLRMTSRVTAMEAPSSFTDEQVRGPFAHFRHVHLFRRDGDGTIMTDQIEFSAPFGPLGLLVEKVVLAQYLRALIEDRNRFLADWDSKDSTAR